MSSSQTTPGGAAAGSKQLEVHLVTPEREVWVGDATFVTARTLEGDIGVLPDHLPVVAVLQVGPLYVDPVGGSRVAAAIDGGFLHVTRTAAGGTRVDVLAEYALLSEELDSDELLQLENEVSALRGESRFEEARTQAAKATARRRVSSQHTP